MARLPLEGIRIIDLSRIWAAPLSTKLLADMGAQVIKIQEESRFTPRQQRASGAQGGQQAPPPAFGGLPPGVNAYWLMNEGNKLGISLDFEHPKGQEVFKRLVAVSDVVVENFRPVVMERIGLDYEGLRKIKPDIIVMSLTAMGHTGPERNYSGFGASIDGLSGVAFHTGYPYEDQPVRSGINYADPVTGMHAAAALLLALYHRQRTGEGQYIDLSLRETVMTQLGELFMEYSFNGRFFPRLGNREPGKGPHGVYRCKDGDPSTGTEERWIAIAVNTEDEWRALVRVMGDPAWAHEPRFADMARRWAHHDELDALIGAWTREQDRDTLVERLQAAGVAAAPVHTIPEVLASPHLNARNFWTKLHIPTGEEYHYMNSPWGLEKVPDIARTDPPKYGEHNRDVLMGLLGYSEEEFALLEAEGVLRPDPLAAQT